MYKMKNWAVLTALILIVSMLTACGATGTQEAPKDEPKKIVIAEAIEWEGVDTYQVEWTGIVQPAHADGMFTFDMETKKIVPNLASELKISDDKKTLTITIPEGLTYGNGETVEPEDVKRSIEWGLEVSPYNWDYMIIQDIQVDGRDVIITSEEFSSTVMYYLTNIYMPIMSKEQIESKTAEELLLGAVQYGAFSIEEFVAGSHATLKRNDAYKTLSPNVENQGASHVEELMIKFMPDGFSRVAGLKAGDIDIATSIPVENVEELKNDPNIEVAMMPTPGMVYLTLNKDNPLFADVNVRKAIAYAIDRDEVVKANNDMIKAAYSFIIPEMMDYSEDMAQYYKDTYTSDENMAKQLLADAGWADTDGDGYLDKDGQIFEFTLLGTSEATYAQNALQVMQMDFKDLGIKLEIGTAENGYIKEKLKTDDYDAVLRGFVWAEPASILPYIIYDSNNLEDEAYFDLLMSAATIVDDEERAAKFAEAQQLLLEEFGFIPMLQTYDITAYRNNISGVKFLFDHTMIFNDLDKN